MTTCCELVNRQLYPLTLIKTSISTVYYLIIPQLFFLSRLAGAMANIVDLAPNFAGPVLAFAQSIHMTASFLSPLFNGVVLTDQKNLDQWKVCFIVASVVAISTYVMFQIHGTAQVQPWNYYDSSNKNETQCLEDGETGGESSENSRELHDNKDPNHKIYKS